MECNKLFLKMVVLWATDNIKITRILCLSENTDVRKDYLKVHVYGQLSLRKTILLLKLLALVGTDYN